MGGLALEMSRAFLYMYFPVAMYYICNKPTFREWMTRDGLVKFKGEDNPAVFQTEAEWEEEQRRCKEELRNMTTPTTATTTGE